MGLIRKISLGAAALSVVLLLAGLISGQESLWKWGAVTAAVGLAIGLGAIPGWQGYQFTGWILAAVITGMIFPQGFLKWGDFDLRNRWLLLLVIQTVMFGMGTQMTLKDFTGIVRSPKGVVIGMVCQFSIMPLTGWGLTKIFTFPPEIAAGIILVGTCSSGLASNVMTYIAGANLALSVTVTAMTTIVAPVMTPFLMKVLGGTLVEIKFLVLMVEIIKIVIVPIGAALLHDYLKHASPKGRRLVKSVAIGAIIWLGFLPLGGWAWLTTWADKNLLDVLSLMGFLLAAFPIGVVYHWLTVRWPGINKVMPIASMAGIVYFTTVTTAAGRDNLMKVGILLFVACALHNAAGYFLGYWLSRGSGMNKHSARAIAFEVGLQNGGMASGLAAAMGKLGTVGLAAAIFSPWMNISGSILANYWRKRPTSETPQQSGADSPKDQLLVK